MWTKSVYPLRQQQQSSKKSNGLVATSPVDASPLAGGHSGYEQKCEKLCRKFYRKFHRNSPVYAICYRNYTYTDYVENYFKASYRDRCAKRVDRSSNCSPQANHTYCPSDAKLFQANNRSSNQMTNQIANHRTYQAKHYQRLSSSDLEMENTARSLGGRLVNDNHKRTNALNLSKFVRCLVLFFLFIIIPNHKATGQGSPANDQQPFASILYTGVLRGKVALPCDVSAPSEDDSVALILWYKDDALAPIYTLDARKGSLDQARTLTSSLLEGRAYFNLLNKPAFLQIDPIKLEDAGDYRCRVDFKKGRTVNTVISFKVIVPPEEPEIKDANGKVLRGLIGPYAESSGLKLTCSTVGGKPRPSLTWFRDYTLLDDSFEYNSAPNNEDITTNTVLIPSLTRHHLLSVFTCQASNNNITVPISTSITLDLNLKPSEVRITQLTPTLVVNREARFQCSTIGARPQARVYFLFNGLRKDVKLNCKPDSQCLAVLSMQITKEMNGASLRCVAENPRILKSEITDQIKLDVQYAPQLNLKLGSATLSLQSIQEGNDIYFDCDIDANPISSKPIIWRFNGEAIQSQTGVIQSNQTLVLQSVIRDQSGVYQCEVTNKQGTSLSNPIELKVKFAPVCQSDYIFVFGVTFYETVHLRCDVDSNPTDVQFFWKLHNSNQLDLVTYNQFNTSSILTYSPQMQQDYGIIECSAKNSVGIQQTPCYFQLVASAPPNIDLNCETRNITENSFIIACAYDNTFPLPTSSAKSSNRTSSYQSPDDRSSSHQFKSNALSYKKALYIFPITFYVCEIYYQDQLISTQNLTIHNPYTNSYLDIVDSKEMKTTSGRKNGRKNEYNKFKFLVNHLAPNSEYEIKISALNRKGSGRPVVLSTTTKKKPDRLFITKITDQHSSGLDGDYVLKNDLTGGLHWLSSQQFVSIPSLTYILCMISVCCGILMFIFIIRKKYKRLILMHSALRSNQFQNNFATSTNAMSISKCLFPFNHKQPELTNEQYEHEHTLMGCCNVDYREDILMPRHTTATSSATTNANNTAVRQLTTFIGTLHHQEMIDTSSSLQLAATQPAQNQQQLCELNPASMPFNTYGQLANHRQPLTNSLTNSNLASSSTRDLYESAYLFSNPNLNANLNSMGNLNAAVSSNLALTNASSNNNCSSPGPPISPPPTYEQSELLSASMLSLPAPPSAAMLTNSLKNSTSNKLYDSPYANSLLHPQHNHQASYVDYTNRYQSLNRKQVHPTKLEEFKQNNLVVNLDVCTNLKSFNSKSLDRSQSANNHHHQAKGGSQSNQLSSTATNENSNQQNGKH